MLLIDLHGIGDIILLTGVRGVRFITMIIGVITDIITEVLIIAERL